MASFVSPSKKAYDAYLLERRKSYEHHYVDCNKANRLSRVNAVVPAVDTDSTSTLCSKSSRCDAQWSDSGKKTASSSNKSARAGTGNQKGKEKKPPKIVDPDVFHRIKLRFALLNNSIRCFEWCLCVRIFVEF